MRGSGFGQSVFGRRSVCRPKGDTEASRRPREKILRFSGYLSCALKVESSASWAATIFVTNVVTLTVSFFSLSSRIPPRISLSPFLCSKTTLGVCVYAGGGGVNSVTRRGRGSIPVLLYHSCMYPVRVDTQRSFLLI